MRGKTLRITGSSTTSRLRYHRWEYTDRYDRTATRSNDTLVTGFRSDFTLDANYFEEDRDPPVVKLFSCSQGYKIGTCQVTTRTLSWIDPPQPVLQCSTGPACRVQAGQTMYLTADSSNTQYYGHWYEWTDGRSAVQRPTYSTAAYNYRSKATFNAKYFNPTTEDIEVEVSFAACQSGYNTGSCVRTTKTITITPEPTATLSCEGGSCSVISGRPIAILGNALNSELPYHRYRYRNAAGAETVGNFSTISYNYQSRLQLLLHGYAAGTETIRLNACSDGYDVGTCVASSIDVTVLAPPTPVLSCSTGAACAVAAGSRLTLSANTASADVPFHRYTWTDGRGTAILRNYDAREYQDLSVTRFDATYFPGDTTTARTVTFQACSSYYNSGTCVTADFDVSVQPPAVPAIECEGGACSVPSDGFTLPLFGDGRANELPYHAYTWPDAAGSGTVTTERHGGTTVFRSYATFSTTGMTSATTRVVTLTACQNNYVRYPAATRGTCRSTTRTIQVVARPSIVLTCAVKSCMISDTDTMPVYGDSRGATSYRYHRWTWVDGAGVNQQYDRNVSGNVSNMTFNATGFTGSVRPTVRLNACATNYDVGPCIDETITMIVNDAPAPVVTCSSGAACRVPAGESIQLTADTQNSNFHYHRWEWIDALTGAEVEYQTTATNTGTGFVTKFPFNTNYYQNTQDRVVNLTFAACTDGYSDYPTRGSCVTRQLAVTVTAIAPVVITCPTPACTAQTGSTIRLTGDSATAELPHHLWRWRDSFGRLQAPGRVARDGYTSQGYYLSETTIDLNRFHGAQDLAVELIACKTGYRTGTCRTTTATITLTAPPPPIVDCNYGSVCEVPAGTPIRLAVDSSASGHRYHQYKWQTPIGPATPINRDGLSYGYNSSYDLLTHGFNPTQPFDLQVDISACSYGYEAGSCARRLQTIRLLPQTLPTITCLGGACSVVAGHELVLAGDSKVSGLRYHTWLWQDANGNDVTTNLTTTSYDYGSRVVFNSHEFNGASTRDISLIACSETTRKGTCVTRTQRVTIVPVVPPTFTCAENPNCEVAAGRSITMIGDGRAGRYRYHTYSWQNGQGRPESINRDTSSYDWRSSQVFSAAYFQGATAVDVPVELTACEYSYTTGSCVRVTRNIRVLPTVAPSIACEGQCRLRPGETLRMTATSSLAQLRYHRWRWRDYKGAIIEASANTLSTTYSSSAVFNATYFGEAATRTVEIAVCSSGYEIGTCARSTVDIEILAPTPPSISCEGGSCEFAAGATAYLLGNGGDANRRYHRWLWTTASGSDGYGEPSYGGYNLATRQRVDLHGFNPSANLDVPIQLTTCTNGQRVGTCGTTTRNITVRPAPAPTIECIDAGTCEVDIGKSVRVTGNSSDALLPYHFWKWTDPSGAIQLRQYRTTGVAAYRSSFDFTPSTWVQTDTVPLELRACSQGYNAGTCVSRTINVEVRATQPAVVTCDPRHCRLQPDESITLFGNATNTQRAFHTWSWSDGTGQTVTFDRNGGANFTSSLMFSSASMAAGDTRPISLRVCSDGFNTGTCETVMGRVDIDTTGVAVIDCALGSNCSVQAGSKLTLIGDSNATQYPYHHWRWEDSAGRLRTTSPHTASTGYRSTIDFDAAGFSPAAPITRNIELVTCTGSGRNGNCASTIRAVTITPAPLPTLTCSTGPDCEVIAGDTLRLTASSQGSLLRYHSFRWTDGLGILQLPNTGDTLQTGYTSTRDFSAAYYRVAADVPVTIITCSTSYLTGTCVETTKIVRVVEARPAPVTCLGGSCTVGSGLTLTLEADSSASRYAYHEWIWTGGDGNIVLNRRAAPSTYRSTVDFRASPFQISVDTPVTVRLKACKTSNYTTQNCVTSERIVTVTPAPAPTITCNSGCTVQAGRSLEMFGDSSTSQLRYHKWRWNDANGSVVQYTNNSYSASYASSYAFLANGFQRAGTRDVTLEACSDNYSSGTCETTHQTITIIEAPAPILSCASGPTCEVSAGLELTITADGRASQFRYQRWSYPKSNGAIQLESRSSATFRNEIQFKSNGYNPTGQAQVVPVTLVACTSSYLSGSCVTVNQDVRIAPAPLPDLSCNSNPTCTAGAGGTIQLEGSSIASRLPYQRYRWATGTGGVEQHLHSTASSGFRSPRPMLLTSFLGAATTTVSLSACSEYYDRGTCVEASRVITVTEPANVNVSCAGGACTVVAGSRLEMIADGAGSRFGYHTWRYPSATGLIVETSLSSASSFRTTYNFDTNGFGPTTAQTVQVEVTACSTGYRRGTCVTRVQTVVIQPVPAPSITCRGSCNVPAGQSLQLTGDSTPQGLEYHEWRWLDAAGGVKYTQIYTGTSLHLSNANYVTTGIAPGAYTIELFACSDGYVSGTCAHGERQIVIGQPVDITLSCTPGTCIVQPAQVLTLNANASSATARYHSYVWTRADGAIDDTNVYGGSYLTARSFTATGFQPGAEVTVTLHACQSAYYDQANPGACRMTTRTITVGAGPVPTFSCGGLCTVQAGLTLEITANSAGAQHRYHTWRWADADGNPVERANRDTNNTGFLSTEIFSANFFHVAGQRIVPVTLFACTGSSLTGSCVTATQNVTITEPGPVEIACTGGCSVPAGGRLEITGSSLPSRFVNHTWQWLDADYIRRTHSPNTASTGFRSAITFDANGFSAAETVSVELFACTGTNRTGSCVSGTVDVAVRGAPAPSLACGATGACTVQAGRSLSLLGNSGNSRFDYHNWTWPNAAGDEVTREIYAAGSNFVSTPSFPTSGFNLTAPQTVEVELFACKLSTRRGSCASTLQPVVITPARTPTIACDNPSCTVTAGRVLRLEGDGTNSGFGYHRWYWADGAGVVEPRDQYVVTTGGASALDFSAASFQEEATRDVTLIACSAGYEDGTCVRRTRRITIVAPPLPTISCSTGPTCSVQAGLPIELSGDASSGRFPYHRWKTNDAAGALVIGSFHTTNTAFRSRYLPPTNGYNARATRTVELIACSSGYETGTCARTTQVVTFTPAPVPSVICTGGACEVQVGLTLEMRGDSAASRLRYHNWRWRDYEQTLVEVSIDVYNTSYLSTRTFSAADFGGAGTRLIELTACSQSGFRGTCATRRFDMTITAPPPPEILCLSNPGCEVFAGSTIRLNGQSSGSSFPYHQWRWISPQGNPTYRDASTGSTYRSTHDLLTHGVSPSQTTRMPIELVACTRSGNKGSCTRVTRDVVVRPVGAPRILCPGASCTVAAGSSLNLAGTSSTSELRYHRWSWRDHADQIYRSDRSGGSTYLTQATFSAANFIRPGARTVTLQACSLSYGQGTCVETTRDVTITNGGPVRITCNPISCRGPQGSPITMTGDSSGPLHRYHRWSWADPSGQRVVTERDTGAGFISNVSFATALFAAPHRQTVTLNACSGDFGVAPCTNITTVVGVDDGMTPTATCEGGTCAVQAGHRIRIFTDASNSTRRYHTYWFVDALGLTRTSHAYANTTTWISEFYFDTGTFTPDTNRTVSVIVAACTSPWNAGTCSTTTTLIRITPAPLPVLACDPADCSVQAGNTIDIIANSSGSTFRYHTYRWTDALSRVQRLPVDSFTAGYRTTRRFDANYFSGATSRVVEVAACEGGYEVGTCIENSVTVDITAPVPAVIECSTGSACEVAAGTVMQMTGNATDSEFRYQTWSWVGPGGITEYHQRVGGATTFRAAQGFDTRGFQNSEDLDVEVQLLVCKSGYSLGTCVRSTKTVSVLAAPRPTITCNSPTGCTVQAGQTLSLHGNSSNSGLRYQRWVWTDAIGAQQQPQYDVNSTGFVSAVTFNADDFQSDTTRAVTLSACSDYFERGTCVRTTATVTVILPPLPVVTCSSGAACEVSAGETIQLIADSSASGMRYHRWRWINAFGSLSVTDRTPTSSGLVSTVNFSTHSFAPQVVRSIVVDLNACDEGQDAGTCVRVTKTVRIIPVQPATLTCASANCAVQMGKSLAIAGNSSASRLRYHQWVFEDGLNNTNDSNRIDTLSRGYQSAISFSANNFQSAQNRSVTLYACSSGYRRGTCSTSTQQVSITQAPLPLITCADAQCEVDAGERMILTGNSSGAEFRYQTWRWTDATGRLIRYTNDTLSTGYRSSREFSAVDFNSTVPQTVTATLTACTTNYSGNNAATNGSCVARTRTITVRPATQTIITCENANCDVLGGGEMRLTGTSSIARFPYHEWTWTGFAGNVVRLTSYTLSAGYRSAVTFDADGFTLPATRDVTLNACSDGYGAGSCSARVQQMTILAAPEVAMRCNPPNCSMQPGFTIDVTGDSTGSQLRYHRYRWTLPNGTATYTDRSAASFENTWSFNTTGYVLGDDPVITLRACSDGYDVGTCGSTQQTIKLETPPAPSITCDGTTSCTVQAGRQLNLTGDASAAAYRYHRWRWDGPDGNPISPRNYSTQAAGYVSTTLFDARGYDITQNVQRTVTLNACHHSYDSGACALRTFTVTITPPPNLAFTCAPASCTVITSQTIQVIGNSETSELRFHTWQWVDAGGVTRTRNADSLSGNYRSSFSLNTSGFDATPDYRIQLKACSTTYNVGTCITRTHSLGFRAPPPPTITCDTGSACEIQSGRTLQVTADSTGAGYRYHTWRWRRADGTTPSTNRDPGANTFLTTEPIVTGAFETNGSDIQVEVTVSACSGGYRVGTCVNATKVVTIRAAPATELTCTPDSCSVQAGLTLPMLGNSIGSRLRYHEWHWSDQNGDPLAARRADTVNGGYRSAQTFSAEYFEGVSSRRVTLSACADSYNRGTCATAERTIQITAAPAPTIVCSLGSSCVASPGDVVQLVGSTANSTYIYHSWRLTRNDGNSSPQNNYTLNTGYLSTLSFNTAGMDGNLVSNRGGEYGTGGWVTDAGILERMSLNGCGSVQAPRSGTYFFGMGVCTDRALSEAHQTIDLTPYATEIDSQQQEFRWGGALATRNGQDVPEIELLFRDGDGDPILRTSPLTTSAVDWTEVSQVTRPPIGSRSVEFIIRGTRNEGSDNDAYFDELFLTSVGSPARIPVELLACTRGYTPGSGSCVKSTMTVNILPPSAPDITCDPTNCRVQAGLSMSLTGDSTESGYRWHRWSWNDADGTPRLYSFDTGSTGRLSVQAFNAAAFQAAANRQVKLQACSGYYNSGTCVESTVDVRIDAPPAPTITCSSGATCRVVVGQTINFSGDSSLSRLRYHTWDWPDTPAQNPPFNSDSLSNSYVSQQLFSAVNFAGAGGTVQVTLRACSSTNGAGTCVSATQPVEVVPGGPASITNSTVTPLPQPERAEYTLDANRPADWTLRLTRRVGGTCTTDVVHRTQIRNVSTANGIWPGLSPRGSYCWEASVEPAGANSTTSGSFTIPGLPTFTAPPTAVQSGFDVTVAAALSQVSTSLVKFGSGDCSTHQTAVRFNGSRLISIPGQVVPVDAFTVEAWVNLSGVANQSRQIFDAGGGAILELSSGRLKLTVHTPSPQNLTSNAVVPTSGWTHVAATFVGGSQIALFVDGLRVAQGPASGADLATTTPELIIGADRSRGFVGDIASMAVYGRALGATELQAHTAAGATDELPAEAGQLAAWHFSEAPGVQSVYDSTGNHNSGLLGRQHIVDGFDPTRLPAFASSQTMGNGTSATATLTRLAGGPQYCYRVVATTSSGPIIASELSEFSRAVDNENPRVVAAVTTAGECNGNSGRTMSLALPLVTDNADPTPSLSAEVGGQAISFPHRFALGDTIVTWVARDYSGNEGRANELVRVVDTTRPIVVAGADVIVQATGLNGAPFNPTPRTARDECGAVTVTHDGPAVFPLGRTAVEFTVVDGRGLEATDSYVVTVEDSQAPTFAPPLQLLTINHDNSACFVPTLPTPTVVDNAYPQGQLTVSSRRTQGPGIAQNCWDLGTHRVDWTASDPVPNRRIREQIVVVRDPARQLTVTSLGLEVDSAPAAARRYYNRPVTVIFELGGSPPPYSSVTVLPEPASVTNNGTVYRATYTTPGAYPSINVTAAKAADIANISMDGFGIDTTPPVIDASDLLDQTNVEPTDTRTYPLLFGGESLDLSRVRGRDGTRELVSLGRGARFDGDARITVANPTAGFFASGDQTTTLSVEGWIRLDGQGDGRIMHKASTAAADGLVLGVERGSVQFVLTTGGSRRVVTGPVLTPNVWHHLVGTYDGRAIRLYVDGRPSRQTVTSGPVELGDGSVTIGDGLVGDLARVALWRTTLSSGVIAAHYQGGTGQAFAASSDQAFLFDMSGTTQLVVDQSGSMNDGVLGSSNAVEGSDPTRIALAHGLDAAASGVVSLTAQLFVSTGSPNALLMSETETAAGTPLMRGPTSIENGRCTAPVSGACRGGSSFVTANDIATWDNNQQRSYYVEFVATDDAGNSASSRIYLNVRNYTATLSDMIGLITRVNESTSPRSQVLADAIADIEVARDYSLIARRYLDGSYLRASNAADRIESVEDTITDPRLPLARQYLARVVAADVDGYVSTLQSNLHADDQGIYATGLALIDDARFSKPDARWADLLQLSRDAYDAVVALYPPYQPMRSRLRTTQAVWQNDLAAYASGQSSGEEVRGSLQRINRIRLLIASTRDVLRDVIAPEITEARDVPRTPERQVMNEILDVIQKTSNTADEEGDLVGVASGVNGCLDNLAQLMLDDREFTLCYLRLNDLAAFMRDTEEALVHTLRWRNAVAVALFNMLELSLYQSPTGLPFVAAGVAAPPVSTIVLPDSVAATVNGSTPVSDVDVEGSLASAYARHAEAQALLAEGRTAAAFDVFIAQRCLLVTVFNRYYSSANSIPSVADPKEDEIVAGDVGCDVGGRSYTLDSGTTQQLPVRGLISQVTPATTACGVGQVAVGIFGSTFGLGTPEYPASLGLVCAELQSDGTLGQSTTAAAMGFLQLGTPFNLRCPAGEVVVGVHGFEDPAAALSVGVQCAPVVGWVADGTTGQRSPLFGAGSGTAFDDTCPSDHAITRIGGGTSILLQQIEPTCTLIDDGTAPNN